MPNGRWISSPKKTVLLKILKKYYSTKTLFQLPPIRLLYMPSYVMMSTTTQLQGGFFYNARNGSSTIFLMVLFFFSKVTRPSISAEWKLLLLKKLKS